MPGTTPSARGRAPHAVELAVVHGRLRARDVVRPAMRTYREQFWRVAGTAYFVFGIVAAVDAFATVLVIDRHVSRPIGAAVTSVLAGAFAMAGVVIYAGILDKVVGAHLHGHPNLPIRKIPSVLPLGRLVAADVVLSIATVLGLALFVVPGIVVFTMWSLVGPIITIEDRTVAAAFTRSWHLVRHHFWLTFVLVTLPLQVEQAVLHAINYTALFDHPVLPAVLLNGLLGTAVGSVVGLVEVVLAYELIHRDRQRQAGRRPPPETVAGAPG
jgi:hypothetical protein